MATLRVMDASAATSAPTGLSLASTVEAANVGGLWHPAGQGRRW